MGLNICKKIIDENEGTIEVFSDGENQGATFQFSMNMNYTATTGPDQRQRTREKNDFYFLEKDILNFKESRAGNIQTRMPEKSKQNKALSNLEDASQLLSDGRHRARPKPI